MADFLDLLSTTRDALGRVYVSTVEAKRYPFVAMQWHPEKASFEFGRDTMPHSLYAKQLAQAVANQFVTVWPPVHKCSQFSTVTLVPPRTVIVILMMCAKALIFCEV
jgi:hypothetical protein